MVDHFIPQKTPDLTGVFTAKDESEMATFLGLLGPLLNLFSMFPNKRPENINERDQFPQGCEKTMSYGKTDRQKSLHTESSIQEGDDEESSFNSLDYRHTSAL